MALVCCIEMFIIRLLSVSDELEIQVIKRIYRVPPINDTEPNLPNQVSHNSSAAVCGGELEIGSPVIVARKTLELERDSPQASGIVARKSKPNSPTEASTSTSSKIITDLL